MSDPGLITFPPQHAWIPNLEQTTDTSRVLLAVAGGALDYYGRGEPYERRLIHHGDTSQIVPGAPTLSAGLEGIYPGKAGQQLFQFPDGAMGKIGQRFARHNVVIWNVWPKVEGGLGPSLPTAAKVEEAEATIGADGLVVWDAMRALALGGVQAPATPIPQDNILPASMVPLGPQGGMAGYRITIEVQL